MTPFHADGRAVAEVTPIRHVPDELLTSRELAAAMKCSVRTIERMKRDGMPYVPWGRRLVRFRLRDALAWREDQERRAA